MLQFKKILLIFIISITIFQIIRFENEKRNISKFDISQVYGNCMQSANESNVGNYVTIHKNNNLTTFPFVFGERVYLYDVESGERALVVNTRMPFSGIGNDIILTKESIFYNRKMGNDTIGSYYQISNDKKKCKINGEDLYYGYSIYENKVFYEKVDTGSKEYEKYTSDLCSDVYVMDLNSGKESLFLEGNVGYFRVIEDKLYCYELEKEKIIVVDIKTGNSIEVPYQCDLLEYIVIGENGTIYIVDYSTDEAVNRIVKYDLNNEVILWSQEVALDEFDSKIHYKNNCIYFKGEDSSIYKMGTSGGDKTMIIALTEEATVSYCDDYIVAKVSGDNGVKQLQVYDYEGIMH